MENPLGELFSQLTLSKQSIAQSFRGKSTFIFSANFFSTLLTLL
ncbi:MAG: hypothetical protein RBJ76_22630 [Stenomitos frigidus ULC029]